VKMEIKKQIFNIGEPIHKTTISIPTAMHEALSYIAEQENESVPKVIVKIIETVLVDALESKAIPPPRQASKK